MTVPTRPVTYRGDVYPIQDTIPNGDCSRILCNDTNNSRNQLRPNDNWRGKGISHIVKNPLKQSVCVKAYPSFFKKRQKVATSDQKGQQGNVFYPPESIKYLEWKTNGEGKKKTKITVHWRGRRFDPRNANPFGHIAQPDLRPSAGKNRLTLKKIHLFYLEERND